MWKVDQNGHQYTEGALRGYGKREIWGVTDPSKWHWQPWQCLE